MTEEINDHSTGNNIDWNLLRLRCCGGHLLEGCVGALVGTAIGFCKRKRNSAGHPCKRTLAPLSAGLALWRPPRLHVSVQGAHAHRGPLPTPPPLTSRAPLHISAPSRPTSRNASNKFGPSTSAPRPASESRDASEDPAVGIVGLCSRPRVGSPMIYSHMRDAQPCSSRMGSSTSNTCLHCTVMRSERPPPRTPDAAGSATLNRRRFEGHLKLFVLPT
mgnify:CR=1 FL=1